jgi:hypothetical protein
MKRRLTIKFLSGLVNLVACLVTVTIILYRQEWFGKGDIYSFIFWTIPLGTGLAVSGKTILSILKTDKIYFRIIFTLFISGLISYGWIYFVFLILGPWINTFSFPIFYIWIVGNFFQLLFLDRFLQRVEGRSKFVYGLLAFPLTLVLTVIVIYSLSLLQSYLTRPAKETYLIPNTFEGRFRVIYGEKCGTNPRIENGRRVLEIPENGLLIIQPDFKSGTIDNEYYLVDKSNKRIKMNELWDNDQRKTMTPGVLLGGSGAMGGSMPDGSSSTESPTAIHFTDFTVFNNDTTTIDQRTQFKFEQRFDSLTTATVEECRRKNGR